MSPQKRRATITQPTLYELRKPREKSELLDIEGILLELHAQGGVPVPVQEYRFATNGRQWRFDYAWPAFRVALEREGGTWGWPIQGIDGQTYRVVGWHGQGDGMTENAIKYNHAAVHGWRVIRATVDMIRKRQFEADLVAALRSGGWKGGA